MYSYLSEEKNIYLNVLIKQKQAAVAPNNHGIETAVFGEELQNKIEENARLHKQVVIKIFFYIF